MSWKVIVLQSLILLSLSYLAIQYFSLNHLNELKIQQKESTNEISAIKEHLESIDNRINQLIHIENERRANQVIQHTTKKDGQESVLSQRITTLEGRTAKLDETISTLFSQQEKLKLALQRQGQRGRGWISKLTEEKKSKVRQIYQQQLSKMQERVSISPGESPPRSEEMLSILRENREELKVILNEILNQEEYQSFLDSIDALPLPPPTQ